VTHRRPRRTASSFTTSPLGSTRVREGCAKMGSRQSIATLWSFTSEIAVPG